MDVNKPIPFEFELKIDANNVIKWMEAGGSYYAIPVVILYLVAIFWGENYMRNKPPWNVRPFLFIWNSILTIFSLTGATRSWSSFVYIVQKYGWYDTVCIADHYLTDQVGGFWIMIFAFSKMVELIDTAFLVTSKKRVTFLHWFHHSTTAFIYWIFAADAPSFARYFCCVNFSVHMVMYAYFAISTTNIIRLHRSIAMSITTFQISQMFVNTIVCFYAALVKLRGIRCDVTPASLIIAVSFFLLYIYLFTKFFYATYFNNIKAKRSTANQRNIVLSKIDADEREKMMPKKTT